jgi:DNA-binding SARP family transcriptional activator
MLAIHVNAISPLRNAYPSSFASPDVLSIRIKVLGAPACYANGHELTELPAQKTRFALLVYLAIERNTSRESVAALLWPDSDDERARRALNQALYELKGKLGDEWIETAGGRLTVTGVCEVDCLEFNKSLQNDNVPWALALYRGAFLEGFALPNNQEFELWVGRQRAQLERTHRKARRDLVEELIAAGKFKDAIDAVRVWLEFDPLEDEANHRLIELLARSGARVEALNAFNEYERRLKDELDVEPLEHTRELIDSVRDNAYPVMTLEPIEPPRAEEGWARQSWHMRAHRRKRWLIASSAAAITVIAIGIAVQMRGWLPVANAGVTLDTTRVVIFPFERGKGVSDDVDGAALLREAFTRWRGGVSVVDAFQVDEALSRAVPTKTREWAGVARELGAGRFVRSRITRLGDSLLIQSVMYDATERGRTVADRTARLPAHMTGTEPTFM